MGEIIPNVHETLQDSLDIVSALCSLNTVRTHLHTARISTFIHQGTLAGIGMLRAFNYPNIWKPRELSNITGIPCAPKYLRMQWWAHVCALFTPFSLPRIVASRIISWISGASLRLDALLQRGLSDGALLNE